MTDLAGQFDDFTLRSRVYPALLLGFPALVNIALLWPSAPVVRLAPLAIATGALYFVVDLVRGTGAAIEPWLIARWGGLPAQRALWISDAANLPLTNLRRAMVERLTGRRLPSRQLERANPARALDEYDAAVRELIPRVRGKQADALLHGENIRYNFRRNVLAVRRLGIAICAAACVGDLLAIMAGYQVAEALTTFGLCALALAAWIVAVNEAWVRQAADTYCKRFYDAISRLPPNAT